MSRYEPVVLARGRRKYLLLPCGPGYSPGFIYLGTRRPAKLHSLRAYVRFKCWAGRMIVTNVEVVRQLQRRGLATDLLGVLVQVLNPQSVEIESPNHNSTPWWCAVGAWFTGRYPELKVIAAPVWVDPVDPGPDDFWRDVDLLKKESIAEDRAWQAELLKRRARHLARRS